jgi:hypothetical protein
MSNRLIGTTQRERCRSGNVTSWLNAADPWSTESYRPGPAALHQPICRGQWVAIRPRRSADSPQ